MEESTRIKLPRKLLIATHNQGKLEEFRALFGALGIEVVGARDFALAEPEETGVSFIDNARIKAEAAGEATGLPVLADDSGIEIEALDGQPGVFTADWAETPNGRDFKLAMQKTYDLLVKKGAPQPWRARFHATLILLWPDGEEIIAEGSCWGQIVWPMRGVEGHGYDPVFQPDGYEITMGEMEAEVKNRISHRSEALKDLFQKLGVDQRSETNAG